MYAAEVAIAAGIALNIRVLMLQPKPYGMCVEGGATSAVGVANDSDGGKQSNGVFPDEKQAPEGPKVEIPSPRGSRREKARKLYAEASEARLARLRFANSRLGNVSHFVRQHSFGLFAAHALQQTRANRDQ